MHVNSFSKTSAGHRQVKTSIKKQISEIPNYLPSIFGRGSVLIVALMLSSLVPEICHESTNQEIVFDERRPPCEPTARGGKTMRAYSNFLRNKCDTDMIIKSYVHLLHYDI